MILHGYFRSTASWRVRIGLAIKGQEYEQRSYHLKNGDQLAKEYLALNPQGLVPSLELDDGTILTQSLAILEYLEEHYSGAPILPQETLARAKVRAAAMIVACDIHPVQNLKILNRIGKLSGEGAGPNWAKNVIEEGLSSFARILPDDGGTFCFGDKPNLADICLVPQLVNARKFGARFDFGRIEQIEASCMDLPAFSETRPTLQHDAE